MMVVQVFRPAPPSSNQRRFAPLPPAVILCCPLMKAKFPPAPLCPQAIFAPAIMSIAPRAILQR